MCHKTGNAKIWVISGTKEIELSGHTTMAPVAKMGERPFAKSRLLGWASRRTRRGAQFRQRSSTDLFVEGGNTPLNNHRQVVAGGEEARWCFIMIPRHRVRMAKMVVQPNTAKPAKKCQLTQDSCY